MAKTELIWQWEDPIGHVVPPDSKAVYRYHFRSGRLVKAYAPPAAIELDERPLPSPPCRHLSPQCQQASSDAVLCIARQVNGKLASSDAVSLHSRTLCQIVYQPVRGAPETSDSELFYRGVSRFGGTVAHPL